MPGEARSMRWEGQDVVCRRAEMFGGGWQGGGNKKRAK